LLHETFGQCPFSQNLFFQYPPSPGDIEMKFLHGAAAWVS
jgi:hypothetical protein